MVLSQPAWLKCKHANHITADDVALTVVTIIELIQQIIRLARFPKRIRDGCNPVPFLPVGLSPYTCQTSVLSSSYIPRRFPIFLASQLCRNIRSNHNRSTYFLHQQPEAEKALVLLARRRLLNLNKNQIIAWY